VPSGERTLAFLNSLVQPRVPLKSLFYAWAQAQRNPTSDLSIPRIFLAAFTEKKQRPASKLRGAICPDCFRCLQEKAASNLSIVVTASFSSCLH
jgi:hypothetical protein